MVSQDLALLWFTFFCFFYFSSLLTFSRSFDFVCKLICPDISFFFIQILFGQATANKREQKLCTNSKLFLCCIPDGFDLTSDSNPGSPILHIISSLGNTREGDVLVYLTPDTSPDAATEGRPDVFKQELAREDNDWSLHLHRLLLYRAFNNLSVLDSPCLRYPVFCLITLPTLWLQHPLHASSLAWLANTYARRSICTQKLKKHAGYQSELPFLSVFVLE